MPFPTTAVIDTGTRPDEDPLNIASSGARWSTVSHTGGINRLQIALNTFEPESAAVCSQFITSASPGPNVEAYVSIAIPFGNIGVLLRLLNAGTAGVNGYKVIANLGTDEVTVFRIDASVETQLGAAISGSFQSGFDQLGASMNGTTITVYRNGVPLSTRTDATYTEAGKVGLIFQGNNSNAAYIFGGGNSVLMYEPPQSVSMAL